jgi:hypothetical protein
LQPFAHDAHICEVEIGPISGLRRRLCCDRLDRFLDDRWTLFVRCDLFLLLLDVIQF